MSLAIARPCTCTLATNAAMVVWAWLVLVAGASLAIAMKVTCTSTSNALQVALSLLVLLAVLSLAIARQSTGTLKTNGVVEALTVRTPSSARQPIGISKRHCTGGSDGADSIEGRRQEGGGEQDREEKTPERSTELRLVIGGVLTVATYCLMLQDICGRRNPEVWSRKGAALFQMYSGKKRGLHIEACAKYNVTMTIRAEVLGVAGPSSSACDAVCEARL